MAKLYFLGGENVFKRDAKEVNAAAFQDAGSAPNVLVFSWARASFDASYRRRKLLVEYLRSLGAESVIFADYSSTTEEITSSIATSDLIYLTGGQTSILATRLRSKRVDRLLRSYAGVVVGRSAGALVLGKKCLVTNRYSGLRRAVKCLGLVDFSVKAHYNPSQDALLRAFSLKEKIYAIPQRSALVYGGGELSVVGEVFLFENGEKTAVMHAAI
jgi:peptidase E